MSDLIILAWTFLRLSFLAIGGGIGVVPEMHRQVVDIHGWLTARQFVDGYALSQVTPGPAMLVSGFVGYKVHGFIGALVAIGAMFGPSAVLCCFIARRWARLRGRPWVDALERALAPLAIGLMAAGVYTVARSALTSVPTVCLAGGAALALGKRWVPPYLVILAAGGLMWMAH